MKVGLRFVASAALVFALLMAPWPGLERGFAVLFRTSNEIALALFWAGGSVTLEAHAVPGEAADTYVRVTEHGGAAWYALVESRGAGYLPLAVFAALALATPIPRRRKLWALARGALCVQLYISFLLWINLLEGLTNHVPRCTTGDHAAWLEAPWWREGLHTAIVVFRLDPSVFVAAPVLIWLLVSVRPGDLRTWARA